MRARERSRHAENHPPLYAVQPGDTLTGIAASQLGDGRQWRQIWDLNASIVADPSRIRVGQLLEIPVDRNDDDYGWIDPTEEEEDERSAFRQDLFRSIARLQGVDPALVHFDANRVNLGKGSWSGTSVPRLMALYVDVASENSLIDTLYGFFGGEQAYRQIADRFRRLGVGAKITTEEADAFRAIGRHAVLREAQDRKGVEDVALYLKQIAAFTQEYPFLDEIGSISEMGAAVLSHAAHQTGHAARAYAVAMGSRTPAQVRAVLTEAEFLDQIAESLIGAVERRFQTGVRNRFDQIETTFGYSRRYVV